MSQRILMFWSGLMAAACIAMGVFVYRVVEQSAEASRVLITNMQDANRELLAESRALNLALIERLDRGLLEQEIARSQTRPAAPSEPERSPQPAAVDESANWVGLRVSLVKDQPGGEPAVGYEVSLTRNDGGLLSRVRGGGPPGPDGRFEAGALEPGSYFVDVRTPWDEGGSIAVELSPGQHHPGEREEVPVARIAGA